jgi:hypothetical protein
MRSDLGRATLLVGSTVGSEAERVKHASRAARSVPAAGAS